jgi:DNA-binding NarL/FixJ family response regulator
MTACGDDDDDDGGGGEAAEGGGTLNVYSSLPLQGASRPQTTAMVEGIRLALQQNQGKAGDLTVKYTSLDDSTAQAGTWTPEATAATAAVRERLDLLTVREAEVLGLLMTGLAVRDIADASVVSEATVRSQVKSILSKLEVSSQLAAVGLAHRVGWTAPGIPAR